MEEYTYYSITKSAFIALTKRLAHDPRKYNIRVNAIAHGTIDTGLIRANKTEEEIRHIFESMSSKTILGRVDNLDKIASIVVFLVYADASFITGQVIVANGGRFDYLSHSI